MLKRDDDKEYFEEEHNHMILIRNLDIDCLENYIFEDDINSNFPHPLSSPNNSQNDKNFCKYDNEDSAHVQNNHILFENILNSPCMNSIAEEKENEDSESYTSKISNRDYQNQIFIQDNFDFAVNPLPIIDFENFQKHNYPRIPIVNAEKDTYSNDLNLKLSKSCTSSTAKQRKSGFNEEIQKKVSLPKRDATLFKIMKDSIQVAFNTDEIGIHKESKPHPVGECSSIEFDNLMISEKASILEASNNYLLQPEQMMRNSSPSPKIIENLLIEVESCNLRDICKSILIFVYVKKEILDKKLKENLKNLRKFEKEV